MTAIANYYAQVGVKLNKADLRSVRTYLNSIEKQLNSFQSRLSKTGTRGLSLNVNLRINTKSLSNVQRDLNTLGRNLTLNISNITFNRSGIGKALKGSTQGQSLRINATLSQQSISNIRAQLQQGLTGLTIPVNARAGRVSAPSATSSRAGSRSNPFHNPMMVGGGLGAFVRYGMYSLPFIGGAMGLNAMANSMGRLQQTSMLLNTSSGSVMAGQEQMQFLSGLGNRLGFTTSGIAPFYAQMYAGSRGTVLQDQLQEGFTGFMEYASVTGMSDEQKKGAARAISQMIAKRQVMA